MNDETKDSVTLEQLAKDNNYEEDGFTDVEYEYLKREMAKATNDIERAELRKNAILKIYNNRKLSQGAIEELHALSEHTVHGDETYTTYASYSEDGKITRHRK